MLLVDKREIEFDGEALVYCVTISPRAAEKLGLPAIKPTEVKFYPDCAEIEVIYRKNEQFPPARIAAESLGALLVSCCVRAKLPMPRAAVKTIRIEAQCAVLAFRSALKDIEVWEQSAGSSRQVWK